MKLLYKHDKIDLGQVSFLYYRGGKICLTDHFKPLWARNVPRFGIAHAMALGVSIQVECHGEERGVYIIHLGYPPPPSLRHKNIIFFLPSLAILLNIYTAVYTKSYKPREPKWLP